MTPSATAFLPGAVLTARTSSGRVLDSAVGRRRPDAAAAAAAAAAARPCRRLHELGSPSALTPSSPWATPAGVAAAAAAPAAGTPAAAAATPATALAPGVKVGRPKTSIKKDAGKLREAAPPPPEADAGAGAAKARPTRKTEADEIPLWKVILLGDEEYEEGHVTTQLQKVVQLAKKEATRVFAEAQASGSALVCVVIEEHAEFYAEQLKRQEIWVTLEADE
ncbi:hypothetical protein MMPV_000139 [Pyropia vietnamensis]